nr:MAG TPA: hypothetical protein [Caudoviricetes sp.]
MHSFSWLLLYFYIFLLFILKFNYIEKLCILFTILL